MLHRTAEIQRLVPKAHWHYIDNKQNPADIATREISFDDFKYSYLWWHSPRFLQDNSESYSTNREKFNSEDKVSELKKSLDSLNKLHS